MKAREKNLVHVVMPVLVVCLLALTCTAYAAPVAAKKSTQQTKSATSTASPASIKYDPNAPPKGAITIPASSKGNVNASTWYTGSYQYIQWTCKGVYSNLVDVALWQNNRQMATIGTGVATGQTAYVVPIDMAAGNYEVRITSKDDPRVEARKTVTVVRTTVTIATPPGALYVGSPYTITWSYTGNPAVKLAILDSYGAVLQEIPNISVGSNGKGSWTWTVPSPPSGKSSVQCRFQIVGTFRTSAASSAKADKVLGTSGLFTVVRPTIQVARFTGWQYSPGMQCQIMWITNLIGEPVKVELYSVANASVVQTIQANMVAQATNSLNWTPPANLPANLLGTSFQIRVTSLKMSSVQGSNDPFIIAPPSITLTLPDPNQPLVKTKPYQIAWKYTGDPGAHVKIEIYSAFNPDRRLWTIADSSDIGLWGIGHFSWNGDGSTNLIQMYIQIQSIETPSVKDRRLYNVVNPSGTTGGAIGAGGGTSSGSSSSTSSRSTLLTQDKSFKYNAGSSATFSKGTTVNLDANGYVINGNLTAAHDQSLDYRPGSYASFAAFSYVTFGGGYVTSGLLTSKSNQYLDYRSGSSAQFGAGTSVKFNNGYVVSGYLCVGRNHSLNYRFGKSAQFWGGSYVTFVDGYVVSGYLALGNNQSLEYRPGKTAPFKAGSFTMFRSGGYVKSAFVGQTTTLDTAKGTQTVPALSYVAFDNNGYLASFNPPVSGGSACYKCNPQFDPSCSNPGGFPPCK